VSSRLVSPSWRPLREGIAHGAAPHARKIGAERSQHGPMTNIPVAIIGGYLGAGKTTLVNGLLRRAQGQRIAVLVNDFGDIDIDADLIEASEDDLISLAGGCVCCSFGSDLMRALERMRSLAAPPDCILIETSGVGLPGAIAASARLLAGLQIRRVVVMVDARAIRVQVTDRYVGDTVIEQLRQAQSLMVSKSEDLAATEFEALAQWLRQMAPGAPLQRVTQGDLSLEALLAEQPMSEQPSIRTAAMRATSLKRRPRAGAKAQFDSVALACAQRVDLERLCRMLTDTTLGVLRLKALLRGLDNTWHSVQMAGGHWELKACSAPRHRSGLVAIGATQCLNQEAIRRILSECCLGAPDVGA
jgi:G3E family GTPase